MKYQAVYMLNLDKKETRILTPNDIEKTYSFYSKNKYQAFQIANLYLDYINNETNKFNLIKINKIEEIKIENKTKIEKIKYKDKEDLENKINQYQME